MGYITNVVFPFVIFCAIRLLQTRFNDLRDIPGPWLASVSNLWKLISIYKEDMHLQNASVHDKYGPIVRIGPNHVSLASPESFHAVHASRTAFATSDFYEVGAPTHRGKRLENLFSIRDVQYHARLRRNIGNLYTKTAAKDFEPLIDSSVELFVTRIDKLSKDGLVTLDMALWLHLYAYDSLAQVNVSKRLGFLEAGQDVDGMIAAANKIFYMVGLFTQAPLLHRLFKILRYIVPAELVEPLIPFTSNAVEQRRRSPRLSGNDMLAKMLKLHEIQPEVSIHEITSAIFINLMAGHDVLAITLRAIWYYLAKNPQMLHRLREGLYTARKREDLSNDLDLSYTQLSSLPFFNAVIYETFRFHPNTGTILERKVPPEGTTLEGHSLPHGTIVGVNAWVLHRNKSIFGQDADVYRPERWLDVSTVKKAEMKKHLFTFGAGPHTCIGQNIAMIQIYKVAAAFFWRFDIYLAQPDRSWKVMGSWVTKQSDMDMVVSRHT